MKILILCFVSLAFVAAAQTPVTTPAKPIVIAEVDALKVQIQDKDMALLDEQYQKIQLQIRELNRQAQDVMARYKQSVANRDAAIDAIYAKAKVAKTAFDLDLAGLQLAPHKK